jgi:dienelactone hydrolase
MIIEWTVYPGASHGFNVPRPSRVYLGHYLNYSPEVASDVEARIRALLAQHLGAGGH